MSASGQERIGRNEATFRRINEAIETGRVTRSGPVGFICECAQLGCNEVVQLTIAEYEAVRANPRRFFIAHGHEDEGEEVVEVRDGFSIVEKYGAAAAAAERADRRIDPNGAG